MKTRLHSRYKPLTGGTPIAAILLSDMRRIVLSLLALALLVPALGAAATAGLGDGTLSVADTRGRVIIDARGGIIGQLDRGVVVVTDLTRDDAAEPIVSGDDTVRVAGNTTIYTGRDIRFRLLGGAYRVQIRGVGIDVSAVGTGTVFLQGDPFGVGVYSFTDDCQAQPGRCDSLPLRLTKFRLGVPEKPSKRSE